MVVMSAVNPVARIMNNVLKDLLRVFTLQEISGQASSVFASCNGERAGRESCKVLCSAVAVLPVTRATRVETGLANCSQES
jgi:hypothetical protein